MSVAKTEQDGDVLGRYPVKVGVDDMLIHLSSPDQVDEAVVPRAQGRNRFSKGSIERQARQPTA